MPCLYSNDIEYLDELKRRNFTPSLVSQRVYITDVVLTTALTRVPRMIENAVNFAHRGGRLVYPFV